MSCFRMILVMLLLLMVIKDINSTQSDTVKDSDKQSNRNKGGVFNFTLQILRRIKNIIIKFKTINGKNQQDIGSSKSSPTGTNPGINRPLSPESVSSESGDHRNNKNFSVPSQGSCPSITYASIMMKVSITPANLSSNENSSSSEPPKPLCDPLPLNDSSRGIVQLLNHTQLIETKVRRNNDKYRHDHTSSNGKSLNSRAVNDVDLANNGRTKLSYCVMMMVYAHFCPFSKRVAPMYVALARAYPQIAFYAIHINDYKRVKSAMSTFGVPKIFLLRNGRTVSVFNKSVKSFEVLKSYIHNLTGFDALENVTAPNSTKMNDSTVATDYGPFTFDTEEIDVYLLFSWTFLICLLANYFLGSSHGERLRRRVVQLWQEHEHVN